MPKGGKAGAEESYYSGKRLILITKLEQCLSITAKINIKFQLYIWVSKVCGTYEANQHLNGYFAALFICREKETNAL